MREGRAAVLIGFAVLLACAAATASTRIPIPGGFAGTTSQAAPDGTPAPVRITMSGAGRRIKSFDITWFAPCDSGFSALAQVTHAEGSVGRGGAFRGRDTYFSDQGNLQGSAYTATITDRLRGRFVSRTRARGSFRATAVLKDPGGRPVSTCRTPRIDWRARHR